MQKYNSDRKQISVPQGGYQARRGGKDGLRRRKLLEEMDMFIILIAVMASLMLMYVKTNQIVYFNYVQFILCHLCSVKLFLKKNQTLERLLCPQNLTH